VCYENQQRRGLVVSIALASFGAWMDWCFGFFVLALAALCWRAGLRFAMRVAVAPALAALFSLAMVFVWTKWAKSAPFFPSDAGQAESVAAMLERALGTRPAFGEFCSYAVQNLRDGFTLPVAAICTVGFCLFWRWDRRLAVASIIPAILNPAVFANHATSHLMFWCYMAVPLAGGLAALAGFVERLSHSVVIASMAAGCVLYVPVAVTIRYKIGATVPVFRDLGATLTLMAESPRSDGQLPTIVATNSFRSYPYYVRSDKVYLGPVVEIEKIEHARNGGARVQFVYVEAILEASDGSRVPMTAPNLLQWLRSCPARDLPALRGRWPIGADGWVEIVDAWVFEL
jgi:hypothetical protein